MKAEDFLKDIDYYNTNVEGELYEELGIETLADILEVYHQKKLKLSSTIDTQKFYSERKRFLLTKKENSRDYISESDVVGLLSELQKELVEEAYLDKIWSVVNDGLPEVELLLSGNDQDKIKKILEKYYQEKLKPFKKALEKISKYSVKPTSETKMQRIKRLKSIADKALFIVELCFNCGQEPQVNTHTGLCKQCYVHWNSGKKIKTN